MMWITWSLAVHDEQEELDIVAENVLARARRSTGQARTVLETLNARESGDCSPAHINEMRRLVFNTPSIEEIGHFSEGRLDCTSWGPVDGDIRLTAPDYTTRDRLGVTLSVRPALRGATPKLALQAGDYNVLLDPVRFVDVISTSRVQMALATRDGRIVAAMNDPDPSLIASLAANPRSGLEGRHISAVRSDVDWTAITVEERPQIFKTLRREQWLLLPIGVFLAGMIVTIIVWFSRRRLSFSAEIALAIRNREFTLQYQPIIALSSGVCVGAEALIRWRRPDGSWVRPDVFIPVAEQSGLIREITGQVIVIAGTEIGSLLRADRSLHLAINLAASDFSGDHVFKGLEAMVRDQGVEPGQIWLEATERGFMDYSAAEDMIGRAKAIGYHIAIDDFGTGYSSLQHLQQMTFDVLKIDKSFVDTIGLQSAKSAVIFHIIEMAKALKVTTVAEGVEEASQADYLRENGVDLVQGWLYSRPLAAADFRAFVERNRAERTAPERS